MSFQGVPYAKPSFPFGSASIWQGFMQKIAFAKHMDYYKGTPEGRALLKERWLMEIDAMYSLHRFFGLFMFGQPILMVADKKLAKQMLIKVSVN